MLNTRKHHAAFTLIEILVVCGIIAILAGLILPVLAGARFQARVTQCRCNLRQIGLGIFSYADDYRSSIPAATPFPTTKLWDDATGRPDSLTVLVTGGYLREPHILFCPLQPKNDPRRDGRRIGSLPDEAGGDVYGSYTYRQHSIANPNPAVKSTFHVDNPGWNPEGKRIRALALDSSCLPHSPDHPYSRVAHKNISVNILFHDCSVATENNQTDDYSIMDLSDWGVADSHKIFINADSVYAK